MADIGYIMSTCSLGRIIKGDRLHDLRMDC